MEKLTWLVDFHVSQIYRVCLKKRVLDQLLKHIYVGKTIHGIRYV